MTHGIIYKARPLRGIKLRGSFHQPHIALAHKIFHRHALAFILTGDSYYKTQVSLNEFTDSPLVALQYLFL
jgi:hypothetical protein